MDPEKLFESEFSTSCSTDPTTNSENMNPEFSRIFGPISLFWTKANKQVNKQVNKQTKIQKKLQNWLSNLVSKIKHHFQIFVHPNIELQHLKNQQYSHMDPNGRGGQEKTDDTVCL